MAWAKTWRSEKPLALAEELEPHPRRSDRHQAHPAAGRSRMVDNQDDVDEFEDEFEDYESLKDRVRRGPLLGVLLGTTLVAGAVWVVLNAFCRDSPREGPRRFLRLGDCRSCLDMAQTARGIVYSVFLVALGSYVVLWLAPARTPAEDRPLGVFSPKNDKEQGSFFKRLNLRGHLGPC